MRKIAQFLTAVALGVAALGAQAQIVNGSFEAPAYADESSTAINFFTHGWGGDGSVTRIVNPLGSLSDGVGSQHASLLAPNYAPFAATLYQSFVVLAAGNYSLNFMSWGTGTVALERYASNSWVSAFAPLTNTNLSSAQWTPSTFAFNNSGPDSYRLTFQTTDELRIDGVSVTAVPEPETYAMMLAGLGAIGFLSRRRKQAA